MSLSLYFFFHSISSSQHCYFYLSLLSSLSVPTFFLFTFFFFLSLLLFYCLSLSFSLPCSPFLSFSLPTSCFLAYLFFLSCPLLHFHCLSLALSLSLSCSSSLFLSCHHSLVITSYHSPSFSWALSLPFLSYSLFKKCWPYRKNELNSSMYLYLVLPRIAVPEQFYNFNWKHIKHWANKNKYIYVNESDPIKSYFNLEPKQQLTFTYLTSLFTALQRLLGEAKVKYRQYYNTVMQYHNDYRAYF